MMRNIKFRAKGSDEETKSRWFYGSYYITSDTTFCFKCDYDSNPDNTHHYILFDEMTDWGLPNRKYQADINIETVGQYTGIHDKNGKELYEGDIFTLGDKRILYVVEWEDTGLRGRQISNKSTIGLLYWQDKIEIIGNIHENPELLDIKTL